VAELTRPAAGQTPLHEWVRQLIEERIECGFYKTDQLLPSAAALGRELSVSLITTRRALRELQFSGAIRSTTGIGSFVNERIRFVHNLNKVKDPLYGITDDARRLGREATIEMLKVERSDPPEREFDLFSPSSGPHYCIKKLILLDRRPITLDLTYITLPVDTRLLDEFSQDFVYEVLRRRSFLVPRSRTYIDANPAAPDAARLLDVAPGFPMLRRFYSPEIEGSDMRVYGVAVSPFDRIGIMIER